MIRLSRNLEVLAAAAVAGSAFGQGAILHDTATVEIVDMPAAIAMGARLRSSRFAFNFNYETARLTLRPQAELDTVLNLSPFSMPFRASRIDFPAICVAQEFCSLSGEH